MTDEVVEQAHRRRTVAIISHPDAGKSTMTEALALHARLIDTAGATHGKDNRRATISDWMAMEQERGISISSTVLQFVYADHVINLVDTPGHADFSEDTYRVLCAVDCAIMLLDAAKGLEAQTRKLLDVCRRRGIPVITVVNKWDRPGLDALQLLDDISQETGMLPTPITWPVGIAGEFVGVLDRAKGSMVEFSRTAGGATRAPERHLSAAEAAESHPLSWATAVDEIALLDSEGQIHDDDLFRERFTTPVLFTAAASNFGVKFVLDAIIDIAPAPTTQVDVHSVGRDIDAPFSAQVFKVQAGMDSAHRDRTAFARLHSGRFERGMMVTHAQTDRNISTKYARSLVGRERATSDEAFPGDVIGIVNANDVRIGDTLYAGAAVTYPPMPSFLPEAFVTMRSRDSSRSKQFHRGLAQLDSEGVIQLLSSEARGPQRPVLGAVGLMQFEVAARRLRDEFRVEVETEPLPFSVSRIVRPEDAAGIKDAGIEMLERSDSQVLAVFADSWQLKRVQRTHPDLALDESEEDMAFRQSVALD
ncbi:peptide chain release factor 3 [soil metagenome]